MRSLKIMTILAAMIALLSSHMKAYGGNDETIEWKTAAIHNGGQGTQCREGSFTGIVGDFIIHAGGLDSNGAACRDVSIEKDGIVNHATLPKGIANGVTVLSDESLICIGGETAQPQSADIYLIKPTEEGKPQITTLPSLPIALENPAATIDGTTLWVSGGHTAPEGGRMSQALFRLDVKSASEGWVQECECPEIARSGATATMQNNGVNKSLYIIGGKDADGNPCGVSAYDLIQKRWTHYTCTLPENIFTAIPMAANHIFLLATDSKDRCSLWKYHTVTNTCIKDAGIPVTGRIVSAIRTHEGFSVLAADPAGVDLMLLEASPRPSGKGLGFINILVIILYFTVLAGIGVYFSRRQKNTDDYFKGGGRIPWWAAGLSLFGTALSAITFMAIPAKAYATDWSYALFNVGILFVAPIIVWVFIPYFRKLNITTAYQYLEIRFNSFIRVICSLAFIVFQVGRMGVVLYLPAIALNVVTGLDIFMCIGIMGICSIIYTMIGGIEAVVWTDALQVVILLGGALFAVIYISCSLPGGVSQAFDLANSADKFSLGSLAPDLTDATVWTVVIAAFFTNLTTYGTDQSMVQRYLTTPTLEGAKKSVWTNALLTIPATVVFFFIGTALYSYYSVFPENLSTTIPNGDAIFPWYIYTELPAGVVGLLISGIFAAAMSTLSGSMNSAATAYIIDIYPRLHRGRRPGLHSARIATLSAGAISLAFAIMMATWNVSSLWDEFQKILGLILGSMGGLFMLGMLTKRANSGGAVVGIAVSMAVQFFIAKFHTFHLLLYTASGFISCFIVGYAASFLFPQRKDAKELTIA